MRPTAADALDGAERLIRSLVADGSLAAVDADPVLALLTHARVPASRLAFLDEDNRALLALLDSLQPALPADLASDVAARVLLAPSSPGLDLERADLLNAELRELLARAVRALPAGADRDRIRLCLLERVEREPA